MKIPKIVRHRTLESCIAAFLHVTTTRFLRGAAKGYWEFYGHDGKHHRWSMNRVLARFQRLGCWGYLHHKRAIHLWFSSKCPRSELVLLLAHELGHTMEPHSAPGGRDEEKKAGRYEAVTEAAMMEADRLTKGARQHEI